MKFNILSIIVFILFQGCNRLTKVPDNSILVSKFRVLDEFISPENINCSDTSVPFLEMKEFDCSFSVEDFEFDIERKYLIDDKGKLVKYFKYLSEAPISYSINELNDDLEFRKYENIDSFVIKISKNRANIIDGKDTLKIERIFKKEKLILIEKGYKNEIKGRRILYEYRSDLY
ncbi:MAG: hypothetical protein GXO49_01865 [Chlorobi bacterium]|nr:hypothetical protein [Chlorobiota bacterium]